MTAQLDLPASADALTQVQTARRRAAVEQAQKSPFMRERLRGISLDRITQAEEWAKVPILHKEDLRKMDAQVFYEDFCINTRRDITEYWRSGGSTGRPLFYPRTALDIHYGQIGFKRALTLAGFTADDIAHMSLPLGIHPAGHMMARSGSDMGVGMVWAGGGNTLPSAAQLDLVQMFQPTAWIGMASYGIQLGNLAATQDVDLSASSVGKILCSAEPLSASKRAKLSALWGAPVRDCYGMTEMMMLGCEDNAQDGFRFWSDYCYPEVVDPDTLEPVDDGQPGLLIVTSLVTNNATPFLRWNTGDIVTMRQGVARGTEFDLFPLIKHTHRTAGFVKVRGVNIGFTDLEDVMFASDSVADFRVEIVWDNNRDEMDIHAELRAGVDTETAVGAITSEVQRVFGVKPRIRIGTRGEIAKTFEGAFKPLRVEDLRT